MESNNKKGRKIGIMGGTFNPIHFSHLTMAQEAYEQFALDEVLFVPSGNPYMKDEKKVLNSRVRAEMCALAIADNPNFSLSTIEIEREGKTYTAETIAQLHSEHPENEYYFIVGADSFLNMEHWYRPDLIFGHVNLLVAVRDGISVEELQKKIEELQKKYACDIRLLHIRAYDLSSTYIRDCVKNGKSIHYYVPVPVEEYILSHKLYC